MEIFVNTKNGNKLMKSFNFSSYASNIELLNKSIKNTATNFWYQGTTVESIIVHEGIHDYFYNYVLKKNGLKVDDSITAEVWNKVTNDIIKANSQIAQEAKKKFPD